MKSRREGDGHGSGWPAQVPERVGNRADVSGIDRAYCGLSLVRGDDMMSLTRWVRQHPIAAFLIWFFPVGWTIAFVPQIARNTMNVELSMEAFIIVSTWLGLLLPMVVITNLIDGRQGLRMLGGQLTRMRANAGWYALGLVAVPGISLALAMLTFGPPSISPSAWFGAIAIGLLLQTVVGFATTNLWEEAAWMGLVQSRFQTRHGVILAAVITALLFMLQHVPLMVAQNMGPAIPVLFFVLVIPFRALMAWIYNRTDSLFLVGLVHAAGDATVAGTITGVGLLPRLYEGYDVGLFGIAANVIIGLVVIVATRARLGMPARPTARPAAPQAVGA
jgi:membrane protease YdiL (CAAX protease family)